MENVTSMQDKMGNFSREVDIRNNFMDKECLGQAYQ